MFLFNKKSCNDLNFSKVFSNFFPEINFINLFYFSDKRVILKNIVNSKNEDIKAKFVSVKHNDKFIGVLVFLEKTIVAEKLFKDFVADISHEFKTPITTVNLYIDTLINCFNLDKKVINYLEIVSKENQRMTTIANDTLELFELENSLLSLTLAPINLEEWLDLIIKKFEVECSVKRILLDYYPSNKKFDFKCDPNKLERVIQNILKNSIRHTPENGKIKIFTNVLFDKVYIKIFDTGTGIPKKELDNIFKRFYRVDKSRSRETGGSGLGLSIVKKIVEAHNGDIFARSRLGYFTEILIELPLG